jgi:hypothetical protein
MKNVTKALVAGAFLLMQAASASAGIVGFTVNQSFSQGNGTTDIPTTTLTFGAAGQFQVDPGSYYLGFDFRGLSSGATFSTLGNHNGGQYYLKSYAASDVIGAGNFGTHVSSGNDWDAILVGGSTSGPWNNSHSGYLGFLSNNMYGWLAYDYTRVSSVSTISFRDGAYNDITNASITAGQVNVSNAGQVPEPGMLALIGLGLAGLGIARRKKAA